MSTAERTVTINHVTLTEAQLREGLRQLEAPPPLTRADIKPGEFFAYLTGPRHICFALEPDNVKFVGRDNTKHVSAGPDGGICFASDLASPVVRRTSFPDTGSA